MKKKNDERSARLGQYSERCQNIFMSGNNAYGSVNNWYS